MCVPSLQLFPVYVAVPLFFSFFSCRERPSPHSDWAVCGCHHQNILLLGRDVSCDMSCVIRQELRDHLRLATIIISIKTPPPPSLPRAPSDPPFPPTVLPTVLPDTTATTKVVLQMTGKERIQISTQKHAGIPQTAAPPGLGLISVRSK